MTAHRVLNLVSALACMGWGLMTLLPPNALAGGFSRALLQLAPEPILGLIIMVPGLLHLAGFLSRHATLLRVGAFAVFTVRLMQFAVIGWGSDWQASGLGDYLGWSALAAYCYLTAGRTHDG